MPLYEYQCQTCGARVEVLQKVSDEPLLQCERCGGRLERLLSAPALQFKGSGWYVTDYAGKGRAATSEGKGAATQPASSDTSATDKATPGSSAAPASATATKK
jgi:putative FmdB family regulatory protein